MDAYGGLCREIYHEVEDLMERKNEGQESLRFVVNGTAERVLHRDKLLRIFQTLLVPGKTAADQFGASEEELITGMNNGQLHRCLATLIFAGCSIYTARTFTLKLVVKSVKITRLGAGEEVFPLPASRQRLTALFDDRIDAHRFFAIQAYFCPIVICKRKEVRLENTDCRRLPYLEEQPLRRGAFGQVYRVKIARGHFFDPLNNSTNAEPQELARKDYVTTTEFNVAGERKIMEKIFAGSAGGPNNILENYGSLAIGHTTYSLFMPLAICDLRAYMLEHHRFKPGRPEDKADLIRCATGLASGLNFLHNGMKTAEMEDLACYHMDLKPSNILIFSENTANGPQNIWKLSDFGMARVKIRRRGDGIEKEKDFSGWFQRRPSTPPDPSFSATVSRHGEGTYLAPESIAAKPTMKAVSDVWSLGCVISIVFAYMEDGAEGVVNYQKKRLDHPDSEGYDRFFLRGRRFTTPKVTPAANDLHAELVHKATQRDIDEAIAVKAMLRFLEHSVLEVQPNKRCGARDVEDMLRTTYKRYTKLQPNPTTISPSPHPLISFFQEKLLPSAECDPSIVVEGWNLAEAEAFKGCEISPDGNVVAYWTDRKIVLYTSHCLVPNDGRRIEPTAEYSLEMDDSILKDVCLTRRYLVASTTRANFHCCIFDLEKGDAVDCSLNYRTWVYLSRPGISKIAISPDGENLACVLGDESEGRGPSSLFVARIPELLLMESRVRRGDRNAAPATPWWTARLMWPAADVANLSFATREDMYIIVRPELTARTRDHKIPVAHIHTQTKRLDTVVIESRGLDSSSTASLFTTFATFRGEPATCALVTREKQIHIQNMTADDMAPPALRKDIKNYRVLKLMMGWRDDQFFVIGRPSASHRMVLLEMTVPLSTDGEISVKEIAQLPGLSADDRFTERLSDDDGDRYVLIAALVSPGQRAIFRVPLPSVDTIGR